MAYNPFEGGMIDRISRSVDNSFENRPLIVKAHRKAEQLFARDAIQPQSFSDLYDPEAIRRDLGRIEDVKSRFDNEVGTKMAADILEAVMYEQTELSNWFGEHASTLKTSEYDDIMNGVDLVIEFNEPRRSATHLALGVDATFGVGAVNKKFRRIKGEIEKGELATIKYFQSGNSNFKGRISNVPRVVVGTERDTVLRLASLWTEGEKRQLAEHPIQRLILEQTYSQLVAFSDYATRKKQHHLQSSYEHGIALAEEALRDKRKIPLGELENDRVNAEMSRELEMFRGSF